MISKLVTIGVYGSGEKSFFQALQDAHVDTFCDIRARRGVRGPAYTFANSTRLQAKLNELHIRYLHLKEFAPAEELRALQTQADKQARVAKRQRSQLGDTFRAAYQQRYLQTTSPTAFLQHLPAEARVVALFCVEREPEACHRSLLATWLQQELHLPVEHITP